MFDLGWSKIIILAVVAIVVVGPKELPSLLRTLGQFVAQLRRHAAEFRAQFDEAMRSTELDQIRRDVEAIKTDAHASIQGIGRSLEQDLAEAKASVEKAVETPSSPTAEASPSDDATPHVNGTTLPHAEIDSLTADAIPPPPFTVPPLNIHSLNEPTPVPAQHADAPPVRTENAHAPEKGA
jgi:sec-independent protein translocase protein TatB